MGVKLTLNFGRRLYGRLFLAIAGLLVSPKRSLTLSSQKTQQGQKYKRRAKAKLTFLHLCIMYSYFNYWL